MHLDLQYGTATVRQCDSLTSAPFLEHKLIVDTASSKDIDIWIGPHGHTN